MTVPWTTTALGPEVTLNVMSSNVSGSIASLKVTLTLALTATSVAPSSGSLDVIPTGRCQPSSHRGRLRHRHRSDRYRSSHRHRQPKAAIERLQLWTCTRSTSFALELREKGIPSADARWSPARTTCGSRVIGRSLAFGAQTRRMGHSCVVSTATRPARPPVVAIRNREPKRIRSQARTVDPWAKVFEFSCRWREALGSERRSKR